MTIVIIVMLKMKCDDASHLIDENDPKTLSVKDPHYHNDYEVTLIRTNVCSVMMAMCDASMDGKTDGLMDKQ